MSNLNQLIETTVSGLGYDVVEIERAPLGVLRIFIDWPWVAGQVDAVESIKIEDCEVVSRQLSRVLEVEGIEYARLEISSPGMDRPLKKPQDFARFAGAAVALKLRVSLNGRKQFTGILQVGDAGELSLHYPEYPDLKESATLVLSFTLDEVEKARLVPRYKF